MGISYGSTYIGDTRAIGISAGPGVGASKLQFSVSWLLHPRQHKYTVFGTYLRVSVAPEGAGQPQLFLGHALPEVAFSAEAHPGGAPFDQALLYLLTLSADQLLALEQRRQGKEPFFLLEMRGNALGPDGIQQINETLQLRVSLSDWVRVLNDTGASTILLVGVEIPTGDMDPGLEVAMKFVRRAHVNLTRGEYDAAVGECRRAVESIWKSAKLEDQARNARKVFSGTMDERKSMSKFDRALVLGEALINFAHPAHHVNSSGDAEIFSRQDAVMAVSTAAGLLTSTGQARSEP